MSERVRKTGDENARSTVETPVESVPSESAQELVDEIDALLDRIDEVLESDAEEFVKNYVQKGGQ